MVHCVPCHRPGGQIDGCETNGNEGYYGSEGAPGVGDVIKSLAQWYFSYEAGLFHVQEGHTRMMLRGRCFRLRHMVSIEVG